MTVIEGIETTVLGLHRRILDDLDFIEGRLRHDVHEALCQRGMSFPRLYAIVDDADRSAAWMEVSADLARAYLDRGARLLQLRASDADEW